MQPTTDKNASRGFGKPVINREILFTWTFGRCISPFKYQGSVQVRVQANQ